MLSLYNLITFGCLPVLGSLRKAHQAPRWQRHAVTHTHTHRHKPPLTSKTFSFLFQLKEHSKEHGSTSCQVACPDCPPQHDTTLCEIQATEGNYTNSSQFLLCDRNTAKKNTNCNVKIVRGWNGCSVNKLLSNYGFKIKD